MTDFPPNPPANPDLLLAATLFLMSQYALWPRRKVAAAVVDHLERLMVFTELLSPRVLLALPRLRDQWSSIAATPPREAIGGNVIPIRGAAR